MKAFYYILLLLAFSSLSVKAQNWDRIQIPISDLQTTFNLGNLAGIRSAQFSNIDLNDDGINDLLLFDRVGNVLSPLIHIGNIGERKFRYAPEYIQFFPKLQSWAQFIDFNEDGIIDIFASSSLYPGSVEVWKGDKVNGNLQFTLQIFDTDIREILQFPISNGYAQVYVSNVDIPAISDIDGDGDIDILAFEPDGSFASYYQNQAVENNLGKDALVYIRKDICWGKFAENQFNEQITLSNDPFSCSTGFTSGNSGTRHAGSTLCVLDFDGDEDKDLLVGDLASNHIKLLINGGNLNNAFITSVDNTFPSNGVKIELPLFLAAFHVDVDGDNDRDLVVTPNERSSGNNTNHVWVFTNVGSDANPNFQYAANNFLINEVASFFYASDPSFVDYNQDGLLDIVVGTNGIVSGGGMTEKRMVLLLNDGTVQQPSYFIADYDFLQLSMISDFTGRFSPTFADIDGDEDLDLFVGDLNGRLYYFENTAGKGQAMKFANPIYNYASIFVGQNAKPTFIDINKDGLLDLVIGEKNNQLNYFQNTGNITSPSFDSDTDILPNTTTFGKLFLQGIPNIYSQSGSPEIISTKNNGRLLLFGTEDGGIIEAKINDNDIYASFPIQSQRLGNISEGLRTTFSLADIDSDGYFEMVVGNERGGLAFYNTAYQTQDISSTINNFSSLNKINITPNPSDGSFYVETQSDLLSFDIISAQGLKVSKACKGWNNLSSTLPSGIYYLQAILNGKPIDSPLSPLVIVK